MRARGCPNQKTSSIPNPEPEGQSTYFALNYKLQNVEQVCLWARTDQVRVCLCEHVVRICLWEHVLSKWPTRDARLSWVSVMPKSFARPSSCCRNSTKSCSRMRGTWIRNGQNQLAVMFVGAKYKLNKIGKAVARTIIYNLLTNVPNTLGL